MILQHMQSLVGSGSNNAWCPFPVGFRYPIVFQYLAECLFPVVCRKCALKNYCTGRFTAQTTEYQPAVTNVPLYIHHHNATASLEEALNPKIQKYSLIICQVLGTAVRAGLRQKLPITFRLP